MELTRESHVLRLDDVVPITGLSRPTLMRCIERAEFPAPRRLSYRAIGWLSNEVDAWLESRPVHAG